MFLKSNIPFPYKRHETTTYRIRENKLPKKYMIDMLIRGKPLFATNHIDKDKSIKYANKNKIFIIAKWKKYL